MRAIKSLTDVQIVLNELDSFKSRIEAKVWDLRGRQIKNGGPATDPTDFVILKQLGAFEQSKKAQKVQAGGGGTASGFGEFSMEVDLVLANPGFHVMVNNFSVDFPAPQTQRVNFCYTPAVVFADLTVKIMILKGTTWSVLETLMIPAGSDHSWPDDDPYQNRKSPYNDSGIVLNPGDFLNFTCETGSSPGLMVKVDTNA